MVKRNYLLVLLSLTATPLILFISTSLKLYLENQVDLGQQPRVLLPFAGLFTITLIFGLIIYALSRYHLFKFMLWAYYLAGPIFLIISVLREITPGFFGRPEVLALTLFMLTIVIIALTHKFNPTALVRFFALLSLLLLCSEVGRFIATSGQILPAKTARETGQGNPSGGLPNVYHLVLDEYQTDMFETTLSPAVRKELNGFIYFPQNTTVYGRSATSIPSILLGKQAQGTPQLEYQKSAFNTDQSYLYWLREAGYTVHAYVQKTVDLYTFEYSRGSKERSDTTFNPKIFDTITHHKDNTAVKIEVDLTSMFWNLWLYSNTPGFLNEKLIREEVLDQIKSQSLTPKTWPIISYASFLSIMEEEKQLPDSNRYTYIHLIIPHFPDVFRADCSFSLNDGNVTDTTPDEQSKCATKIVLDFISLLKRLNRFDNSLIIIHADHGGRYAIQDGRAINIESKGLLSTSWNWARSRALLLIKPPGRAATEDFYVSQAESTLLDITPTIFKSLGLETNLEFEGISLVDPTPSNLKRRRYYYFNLKVDELRRFVIEDGQIRLDEEP